ncbi:MAG: hypothetical protein KF784_07020 [Fimbriimonadaceae bacterium]|nr:hypothetical protein [Fimbriimonadaceae bacterium]
MFSLLISLVAPGLVTANQDAEKDGFAGSYFIDRGYATEHLNIESDGSYRSYAVSRHPVQGPVGQWKFENGFLRLRPSQSQDLKGLPDSLLVPIAWGERRYLVDRNQLAAFAVWAKTANDTAGIYTGKSREVRPDFVKRLQNYYIGVRQGDPELPSAYMDFYKNGPAVARVIRHRTDDRFELDKGSEDRLFVGLVMFVKAREANLEIVSVTEHAAVAAVRYSRNPHPILVGDTATSGDAASRPFSTGTRQYESIYDVPKLSAD